MATPPFTLRSFALAALVVGSRIASAGEWHSPASSFVWTWDRNEDLRFLPAHVGVAIVEASIELRGETSAVRPRYTRLQVRRDTPLLPVVHIDAAPAWRPSLGPQQKAAVVETIVAVAERYGTDSVQVDFEALPSQEAFYVGVLKELRAQLPQYRISITALASWCANPELTWLQALPVDEVVAMPFRMGHDSNVWRRKIAAMREWPNVACKSTSRALDEAPLNGPAGARTFLFSSRPWTPEVWQRVSPQATDRHVLLLKSWISR